MIFARTGSLSGRWRSWKNPCHEVHGVARSQWSQIITRTQEPDDHDHSGHNGTSGQLQEFKVVDSLSGLKSVTDEKLNTWQRKVKTPDLNGQNSLLDLCGATHPKSIK